MTVCMVAAREWQDAGIQRPLSVGMTYELPDNVALSLIATGAATRTTVHPALLETKPAFPQETKVRGRRAASH
jgi:hypothetical protein